MKKIILGVLVFLTISVYGQVPSPLPNTYVNDFAGKLTTEQIQKLNEQISILEKKSSVQFAVILVNDIEIPIEDYAREIGRKWHVGKAQNGLVYVAVINQRLQRLEVASQLEGDIPDIIAKELTTSTKPYFKEGDFYGGLNTLVEGVNERIDPVAKEQRAILEKQQAEFLKKSGNILLSILGWLLIFTIIGAAIYFFYYKPKKRREKELAEAKRKEEQDKRLKESQENWKKLQQEYQKEKQKPKSFFDTTNISKPKPKDNSYNKPIPKPQPIIQAKKEEPKRSIYIAPVIIAPSEDTSSSYSSSSSDSSSSSSSSSSSDYGSWGSDSSSSSDSGFSGGGSSDGW